MASHSLTIPFEKLRGRENFDTWQRHAKSYLIIKNCWSVVERGLTSTSTEKEKDLDQRALAEITLMMEPSNFAHIASASTAKDAWEALVHAYEDSGLTRKVELLRYLVSQKLRDFATMEEYINTMVLTSLKLTKAGLDIGDELTASLMLAGLPEEFRALVFAVENSKTKLSVDVVKNLLLQDVKLEGKEHESALNAKANSNNKKSKKFRCHRCKRPGHFAKNCTNKVDADEAKNKLAANQVLFASLIASNNNNNTVKWYVDSGATCHMSNNKALFTNLKKASEREVTVANSSKVAVEGTGDVKLVFNNQKSHIDATVKDVEYVPDLCTNLLSVGQITKHGNRVLFEDKSCKIMDRHYRTFATANLVNGLYELNHEQPKSSSKALAVAESFELWHRRLGHICDANLKKVELAANDVKLCKTTGKKCITCIKGKQTREPFKEAGTRAEGLLDLVHSDVVGPMSTKSLSGARFLLTFVDDFSRKVFAIPIKRKADVFNEFIKLKNLVENQCGRRLKILRTDNGGEYVNERFKKFLQKQGITHQLTTPYTPEQNGVAERMNRTLIERVRCMLIDADLDKRYWAEAANTAAYLVNRVPCRNNLKCPEEIWSGRKPSLKHIRIFGCKAMAHVPKEKRKKLDAKSTECILVGYCAESKAYRLIDKQSNKLIISRDVIFIETESKDKQQKHMFVDIEEEEAAFSEEEATSSEASESDDDVNDETYLPSEHANDETYVPSENDSFTPSSVIRRSQRVAATKQQRYNFLSTNEAITDPASVKEALSSRQADEWRSAMAEEIESHRINGTWTLADLPEGKNAIKNKWVFKTKIDADGNEVKKKARLVAKGCTQQQGIDYDETFAPVVRYTTLRFLFALAAKHELKIYQMDAVTAFLNGVLKEEIFMQQPEYFADGSSKVCKLNKSIYGLKQSSRVWYEKLDSVLVAAGLNRSSVDQCVYFQHKADSMTFVTIYVDDLLIFTNNEHYDGQL
jgi:transposase InsO family protein